MNNTRSTLRRTAREALDRVRATTPTRPETCGIHAWITERARAAHQALTQDGLTIAGFYVYGVTPSGDTLELTRADGTIDEIPISWEPGTLVDDHIFTLDIAVTGAGIVGTLFGICGDHLDDQQLATTYQLVNDTNIPLDRVSALGQALQ